MPKIDLVEPDAVAVIDRDQKLLGLLLKSALGIGAAFPVIGRCGYPIAGRKPVCRTERFPAKIIEIRNARRAILGLKTKQPKTISKECFDRELHEKRLAKRGKIEAIRAEEKAGESIRIGLCFEMDFAGRQRGTLRDEFAVINHANARFPTLARSGDEGIRNICHGEPSQISLPQAAHIQFRYGV